jgi:predicted transcriptional regulator
MTEKTKYPIEFLNAIKELKDKGIIAEVKGTKDTVKLTKKGWKVK